MQTAVCIYHGLRNMLSLNRAVALQLRDKSRGYHFLMARAMQSAPTIILT
jgi:hypothetical protein